MLFRYNVLKMLWKKGGVTRDLIALMGTWRHSGFNVFVEPRILSGDETTMENLAPVYHPGLFFPGANDQFSTNRSGRIPVQGRIQNFTTVQVSPEP